MTQPKLTDELTKKQVESLLYLLEKVENAESAIDAVWLSREGRKEIGKIRKAIEEIYQ